MAAKKRVRKATLSSTGILPGAHHVFQLADQVELRALLHADRRYSHSELVDDLKRANDLLTRVSDCPDEVEEHSDTVGDDVSDGEHHSAVVDGIDGQATDVFRHLQFRRASLAENYPFKLDSAGTELAVERAGRPSEVFYTFLLLASNLARVDTTSRQLLARHFEVMCAQLLGQHLGWRGQVTVFGTTSRLAGSTFKGTLWKKVNQLAELLGESVVVAPTEFSPMDNGDNGLDIVAHLGFGDRATGRLVLFAQCACSEDWPTKQHSSTQDTWQAVLSFAQPIIPLTFIPHLFRDSSGEWAVTRSIHRTVVVDRMRLVRAFGLGGTTIPDELRRRLVQLVPGT